MTFLHQGAALLGMLAALLFLGIAIYVWVRARAQTARWEQEIAARTAVLRESERRMRAIEIHPVSAIDYANIGSNLRELGLKREAVSLYRMALELDPDIDFARDNITRLEAELKQA